MMTWPYTASVFNLQGSEIIFILLIALVVLGPEKLPGAIKRAMRTYAELRKMGDGFQSEFKSVIDEPLREMKETAGLIRDQVDPKKFAEQAERQSAADAAAEKERKRVEVVTKMHADGAAANGDNPTSSNALPDEFADPEGSVDEFADPIEATPDESNVDVESKVETATDIGPANEDTDSGEVVLNLADAELVDGEASP
jgi:sec-independent protein translocase protein TatB